MKNLVGNSIPSDKLVSDAVAQVDSAAEKIGPYTVSLSSDERLRALRFRGGGEKVVALLGALATRYGLVLPSISVEGMNADLELAETLEPLARAVAALARVLDDTILEAKSECWWAATAYYTALARMTGADPKLEAELREVVDFFAIGARPKPAEPKSPSPA